MHPKKSNQPVGAVPRLIYWEHDEASKMLSSAQAENWPRTYLSGYGTVVNKAAFLLQFELP